MSAAQNSSQADAPSLEKAEAEITRAMDFVHWYSGNIYDVTPTPVTQQQATAVASKFLDLSTHLTKFYDSWTNSKLDGPDRIYAELDMDLLKVGRMDMRLFETIIRRMNSADKDLPVIRRVIFYLDDFRHRYNLAGLKAYQPSIGMLDTILNQIETAMASDVTAMKALVERCNLYYQNRITGRTYYLQYIVILLAAAALIGPSLPQLLKSSFTAFVVSVLGMATLGLLTWLWFESVDKPSILRTNRFKRFGSVPLSHRVFEIPAFFCAGLAIAYEYLFLLGVSILAAQVMLIVASAFAVVFLLIVAKEGPRLVKIGQGPGWQTALAVVSLAGAYFLGLLLALVM